MGQQCEADLQFISSNYTCFASRKKNNTLKQNTNSTKDISEGNHFKNNARLRRLPLS